jgi:hypothetical protein
VRMTLGGSFGGIRFIPPVNTISINSKTWRLAGCSFGLEIKLYSHNKILCLASSEW